MSHLSIERRRPLKCPAMKKFLTLLICLVLLISLALPALATDTTKAIVNQGADYLLSVKDNQPTLKAEIGIEHRQIAQI